MVSFCDRRLRGPWMSPAIIRRQWVSSFLCTDLGRTTNGTDEHLAVLALGTRPTLGEDNASIEGISAYDYRTIEKVADLVEIAGKFYP